MEAFAISKFNRISVKKIQKVVSLIRKMSYIQAMNTLLFMPHKSAVIIRKLLKSAGSNLSNKGSVVSSDVWVVKSIMVSRGSFYKRMRPRARGQADRICKPTSNVKVIISEKV